MSSQSTEFLSQYVIKLIKMLTVNADFERSARVRHQLETVCVRDGAIARHVIVNGAARVFVWGDL